MSPSIQEQPHVTQIHTFAQVSREEVLTYTAAVEQRQSHPIARAILAYAAERNLALPKIDDTRYEMGYGLQAEIAGKLIFRSLICTSYFSWIAFSSS